MDIGEGTPLIALDGSNPYPRNLNYPLTVGALYFVARVYHGQTWQNNGGKCPKCNSTLFVTLTAKPNWGYSVCKFRPLNDGRSDLIVEEAERTKEDA